MGQYRWWQISVDPQVPQGFRIRCSARGFDTGRDASDDLLRHLDEHASSSEACRLAASTLRARSRFSGTDDLGVPPMLWLVRHDSFARVFVADGSGQVRVLRFEPPTPSGKPVEPGRPDRPGSQVPQGPAKAGRPGLSQPVRRAGWALLGVVLGLAFLIGGIANIGTDAPQCGGSSMEQGDVCQRWDEDWSDDSSYEEEVRGARGGAIVSVVAGLGILVGMGFTLRYWAKRKQLPGQSG